MNTQFKTIEIKSIQFESNDPEVLVKGSVKQGHLEHSTDILISQTQLNKIINQLHKQNDNFSFNQSLIIEKMFNDEFMYTANFTNTFNTKVYLHELLNVKPYVQIRA